MVVILSFLGFLTIRSENWNWITVWVIFSICLGLLYSALNILTYKRNLAAGAKSAGLTADSVTSEFPPHSVPQFMPLSGRSEAPTELLNPHPERPKERL
jgi:hypothetical protein